MLSFKAFRNRSNWIRQRTDAWFDSADSGRAVFILLGLFVAQWTIFNIVAFASQGLHADQVEIFAWSRHPAAGYSKHPPLGAFIAIAWFSIFPSAEWAFYLLAVVNAATGLFAIDLIARRYLSGDKRTVVLLLLMLTPFYQFIGGKFNANQILLSTWPIATYCFLRAFRTRDAMWSVLVGVTAAIAMLGKYYSIFLIGGFLIAALSHPARWTYLKSLSPWVSAGCGLLVLSPHIFWLMTAGFQPFSYALEAHAAPSFAEIIAKMGRYLAGGVAYVALPIAVYLLAVMPNRAMLWAALWPSDSDRRMLAVMLAAFLLLPVIVAPFIGVLLTSVWTMSAWFLLPIVLLTPDSVKLPRAPARRVALLVFAINLGALIASPGLAWYFHLHGTADGHEYFVATSDETTNAWHRAFGTPLRIVMGSPDYSYAMTFYSPDRPDSVPGAILRNSPWVSVEDLKHNGFVVVCAHAEPWCLSVMETQQRKHPLARGLVLDVTRSFLGHVSQPHRVLLLLVPPQQQATSAKSGKSSDRTFSIDAVNSLR